MKIQKIILLGNIQEQNNENLNLENESAPTEKIEENQRRQKKEGYANGKDEGK